MFKLLRTRDMKNYLKQGVIFRGYDTRYPQFTSFKLENGSLMEFRHIQHPINVGAPSDETKAELIAILDILPTDSILLATIGHTTNGIGVEVITDLVNDSDMVLREEASHSLHLTLASAPLEIGFVKGYSDFINPNNVDNGKVMVAWVDGGPAIHNISSAKVGRLRISKENIDEAGNSASLAYLVLEADNVLMLMYYRALPDAIKLAMGFGKLDDYVGKYLEFTYRSISNWQTIHIGKHDINKEVICYAIHDIVNECNGPLLAVK